MAEVVGPAQLRRWALPQAEGSKHARGHAVVVGGAAATPGAVLLAGIAALRVGAGVLALAVPEAVAVPLGIAVPEAMAAPISLADGRTADLVSGADAVLIGPGLDDPDVTREVLDALLPAVADDATLALDAFALGVLADAPELVRPFAGRVVLTPNGSEAARLLGTDDPPDDAGEQLARRFGAVVSLGGTVSAPDAEPRSIDTGHAGLGTSGSGDVLAGAVVGLLARGATPAQAACFATYLHAASGDRLAARVGRLGFLARELLDELPLVLTELTS